MSTKEEKAQQDEAMRVAVRRQEDIDDKEGVLNIYEDLFQTIWGKIVPTLGAVTTAAILKRAVHCTKSEYAVLDYLQVTEQGLVFDELRSHLGEKDRQLVLSAFKELVANLFDVLARLTGNILVDELNKLVEGKT